MSFITKTKEAFGWIDGNLTEAQGGEPAVTIASLLISSSAAEWSTFETNFGTTGSLLKALNDAWSHGSTVSISVETITEATYEISSEQVNTSFSFINPVPGEHVLVALPTAASVGEGGTFDILAVGEFQGDDALGIFALYVDEESEDYFAWTSGDHTTSLLGTSKPYSKIKIISDGVSCWSILDGYGWWGEAVFGEGGVTYSSKYAFSANIQDGVEDNVVTIDDYGNIKDSGVAVGDLGGGTPNLSAVIMPTVGTPTSMDRGDEWFNVSYSTSVISGFDIDALIPDDRLEPIPLTYKLTLLEGDCCIRETLDLNSAITVYDVAGDNIYITGPLCYVYIDPAGESGPFINSTTTWSSNKDKIYALLYVFTIYEENVPVEYTLASIEVETETNPVIVGNSTQCTAWGTYIGLDDPMDITALVTWTSSYPGDPYVSVSEEGLAYGEASGGNSTITATLDAIHDDLAITCNTAP
jgi:hypothetical protein